MFDDLVSATAGASGAGAVDAWTRVESAACARRLAAMVAMLDAAHAADGSAEREQWCIDNWAAVCAHIGAAQRLTAGAASGLLLVGTALRDRFPQVGALFAAGLIDYRLARTIVHRGMLVTDPATLRALDAELARALQSWAPMSAEKTEQAIDAFVERYDPHAVRRTQTHARSRSVDVAFDDGSGLAELFGTLFAPDAAALDARLDAFADTVCTADPRTRDQRRADAVGALAHGAERLACLCDTEDCPAANTAPSSGVIVHVVAHRATVTGPTRTDPDPDVPDNSDHPNGPRVDEPKPAAHRGAAECAGLDGLPPRMFSRPLRDLTLAEALTNPDPGDLSTIPPAVLMGGRLLPGAIARRTAQAATIETIIHPGLAPPEPRYRPSTGLADFVRCRDLTCRYPGCTQPATTCDLDHTIPWPWGPTCASNLKALCRKHHLLKTFWAGDGGWRDRQLPNGDVIWTTPDGRNHLTTPGSRLLFPTLSQPTTPVTATKALEAPAAGSTMPRRTTTRAHDRTRRIAHERALNRTEC